MGTIRIGRKELAFDFPNVQRPDDMLYFLLSFLSTILGGIVGVGGGLVIRAILAFLEVEKGIAAFSSATAVLAMAIVNLALYRKNNIPIELKGVAFLALGNILGGFLGGSLIPLASTQFVNGSYILVMFAVLFIMLFRDRLPHIRVGHPIFAILLGVGTGILSGFFGIGGGPFQMVVLLVFFDLKPKDAVVQSIAITLLTTASSLIRYTMNGSADFSLAIYMIPAAILGGWLGGRLQTKIEHHNVARIFIIVILGVIVLQIYSFIKL
jgi:uncharacterized membrane protein YfcA